MSKILQDKIAREIKESAEMRNIAIGLPYKQGVAVRREQNKKYKKVQFLKGLNDALRKIEGEDNDS